MAFPVESIAFTFNGREILIKNCSPRQSLNEWIRAQHGYTGTKIMCGEGGCGCCVVAVSTQQHPETTLAINSCLCPLYSVNGWTITTVEGIGSSRDGFHEIQKRVSEYNASQCGYCTPGMVMNMYSLLKNTSNLNDQVIEDSFDGNICRCTGYRPILDCMKSFAGSKNCDALPDIEDTTESNSCRMCHIKQLVVYPRSSDDPLWYQPTTVSDVFSIMKLYSDVKVKVICGDTGKGIFKDSSDTVQVYVDLKHINELRVIEKHSTYLSVGSSVSLNQLIEILESNKTLSSNFEHLANHLKKIANVPVRNIASWAGNLMLAHDHINFPSDVYTIMEAACASVNIGGQEGVGEYPLRDFLKCNMSDRIILSLQIPFCKDNTIFRSFKIMPRAQNAHAYVNAAFSMEIDPATYTVKTYPSFVFGGIQEHAIAAINTEKYLVGKQLLNEQTLQEALSILSLEIQPNTFPLSATPAYRKSLALSLFYKYYLAAISDHVGSVYQSAAHPYVRPISHGTQAYDSDKTQYPISEPMTKLSAKLQASGEAEYTTDIPVQAGELCAAFVLTTQANAKIIGIDFTKAMAKTGAFGFATAKDIPENGANNYISVPGMLPELLFASGISEYAGQALGIVLADTVAHANEMADAVIVQYEQLGKPIFTIHDAIEASSFFDDDITPDIMCIGDAKKAINESEHVVQGEVSLGTQYHFHLETQCGVVIPNDDGGYTVYNSTQWTQLSQCAIATVLGIPINKVDVIVKRVGGAYGGKLTRASVIAAACGLGAYITRRPVRIHMDISTNMRMIGKRFPYYAKYSIGCTKDGGLNGIIIDLYTNSGCYNNDLYLAEAISNLDNVYKCPNWLITPKSCKTNTCCNTFCRAPGYLPAIFIIESMMDKVASMLDLQVDEVKQKNFYAKGDTSYLADAKGMPLTYCNIQDLWKQIYSTAEVDTRKDNVVNFNKVNHWRKRGISLVPMRYGIEWAGANTTILVNIYVGDGTVTILHGGVEIGQGINTKTAQVAAKTLNIPLELVTVKPTTTLTNPNGASTGGSITSELNCLGVLKACTALKGRLDAFAEKMENKDPPWADLVKEAFLSGVDLSEKYYVFGETEYACAYNSYGVTCAEVEIDVLTGETQVIRVDILYDCGQSINPEVDIGQVEGAFVMGLGYWLTENIVYDPDSGQILTHNTWEYKPPSSKDIPVDLRIELLKNAPNPLGVLRSKAVGEPPMAMSNAVVFAVKRAVESARHDCGNTEYFTLTSPATVENIQQSCAVNVSEFKF